jgi:TP901 family phage tail tape measure protein
VGAGESTLAIIVKARDLASATLGKIGKNLDKLGTHARRGVGNAIKNLEKMAAVAAGAGAAGVIYAVKAAGDFESQLNIINTVAQKTPELLTKIGDGIRKVSRETGTTTEDLTSAYYDLVSAGISAADAQGVLEQANKLAIGGLSTTGEAVDLLTTAINSYGGDASKAAAYANMFAEAIAAGKTTAAELAASFATVGPMAAQFGIGLEEIAAAQGVMTAKGTSSAEAFTQIRAAMQLLLKPTAQLKKLQKGLGVDFAKMAQEKGLAFTYNEIAKAADKAGIPMSQLTGRVEAAMFAAQVTGSEYAKYVKELDKVKHSSDGAGVAQQLMEQRQKGLTYQLGLLRANIHDAAITIGSELIPEIVSLAQEGTGWLQGHQPEVKKFAKDLAGGFREAVGFAKSLDWPMIGNSLRIAGAGAKTVATMFMAMPDWVKTAVITGWGLNKLTGGELSNIGLDIGKIAFQQFAAKGSSPANPLFVKDVGLGGGLPGGAATAVGAGALTTGLALTTAIVAPLAVGAAAKLLQDQVDVQGNEVNATAQAFAPNATDAELAGSIDGLRKQLDSMPFNTFDSKNKIVATLNTLIEEQNRRTTSGQPGPARPTVMNPRGSNPETRQWRSEHNNRVETAIEKMHAGIGPLLSQIPNRLGELRAGQASDAQIIAASVARTGIETKGTLQTQIAPLRASMESARVAAATDAQIVASAQARASGEQRQAVADGAVRTVQASQAAGAAAAHASVMAGATAALAARQSASAIVAAIRANRPVVKVSPTTIIRTTAVQARSGANTGSRAYDP